MNFKKLLSFFLVVALLLSCVATHSFVLANDEIEAVAEENATENAAKIGDKEYATLEEAILAVEKNTTANATTILLLKDYKVKSTLVGHTYAQNIIIDLGGHTLSASDIALTAYRAGTTLTLQNGTVLGNSTAGTLRANYGGTLVLGENLTVKGAGGSAVLLGVGNGTVKIAAANGVKFEGGKTDVNYTDATGKFYCEAAIGRTYFATLADAFNAAQDEEIITLVQDIELDYSVVNNGKILTLDLNGKTITGTDNNESGNFYLINNQKGTLTVGDTIGGGKITLEATHERIWSASSVVIANNLGTLTITGGTIEHLGGTSMAYALDNLTNGKNTVATLYVKGGVINSTYFAIRQFANNGTNYLYVLGGTIGYVWMQSPNDNQNVAHTVVENGIVDGVCITGKNADLTLSVKADCLAEGGRVYGNMPNGMVLQENNGIYGIALGEAKVGTVGYNTFAGALAAANDGDTVTLLKDITSSAIIVIDKAITLDGNGHTLTSSAEHAINVSGANGVTIKNLTVKCTSERGINVIQNATNVTLENVDVTAANYAVNVASSAKGAIVTVNNSTLTGLNTVNVGAENALITVNGGKVTCADSSSEKFSALALNADAKNSKIVANNVEIVVNGDSYAACNSAPGGEIIGVTENVFTPVAVIYYGNYHNTYASLKGAIAAAKTGDTIVLLRDIEVNKADVSILAGKYESFFIVEGKAITVDLNGCNVYADATEIDMLVGIFATVNGGHLTIKGEGNVHAKTVEAKPANCIILNYDDTSKLIINGGNYYTDYSSSSLIYAATNEGVIINGGTFTLGNLGTGKNGSPWLLNAKGQNTAHITVNGGTFQADIIHQYYPFEVVVPKELALTKTADGMYTVVEAVAYVTEREWSSWWYTNDVGYATLEEAIAACEGAKTRVYYKKAYVSEQEIVVLLKDIVLDKTLEIAAGKSVVINMNGYTISYTSTEAKASSAINNKGALTLKNGTVTYNGIGDPAFGYGTNTINNYGTLTIENGTEFTTNVINTTASGSSVAIDCYAGSTLIVNGGNITSVKNAIRLCPFSGAPINATIYDGVISGSRAIQIQLPSNKPADAPEINLTIYGGEFNSTTGLAIYSYSAGQSFANVTVDISGGIFNGDVAFGGGNAKTTQENVTVLGGEFNGYLGRYVVDDGTNDGWEDIAKPE